MGLGDSAFVQNIVADINHVANQSVALDSGLDQAQRNADNLVKTYGADFSIVNPLPPPLAEIKKTYQDTLWDSRDMASAKYITHLTEFVQIKLAMVEMVQTDQDRQDAIGALKDTIAEKDPVKEFPLKGFEGVTKAFSEVWSAVADEANNIVGVLEKATTPEELKKTIEQLKHDLVPVKEGCNKIKQALNDYATKVN